MHHSNSKGVINKYFLNLLITANEKLSITGCFLITLLLLIFPASNLVCSLLDKTLYLPNNGKGLFQHYGIWTIFFTTPVIVILTAFVSLKFIFLLKKLDQFCSTQKIPDRLKKIIATHLNSFALKTDTKYILLLFVIVGFMFSVVNILQTINPIKTYGNDTYDGYMHFCGFLANKIHLTLIWTIVYPIVFYLVNHIYFSLIIIVKEMHDSKIFKIDIFNKDRCGGLSKFGFINFIIICIYANVFLVIVALKFTHTNNYFTLNLVMICMSIFFIIHNFIAVYYLRIVIINHKSKFLETINANLNENLSNLSLFRGDLLLLRKDVMSLNTTPYSSNISKLVNLIKFLPSMIAFSNYFLLLLNNISKYLNKP